MKTAEYIQAFIPAAGLGTRLKPLTDKTPKALVTVGGLSLLERAIAKVKSLGARHIVVNIHHFADQIADFVKSKEWGADIVLSDERTQLLDTGGAIRHAAHLFKPDLPILIHNVDVLSAIDLTEMIAKHQREKNLVTLAVSKRDTSRLLLFNNSGLLCGWHNKQDDTYLWSDRPVKKHTALAFSGIAVVSSELPSMLPPDDSAYPIIPEYLRLAAKYPLSKFEHCATDWIDVGKIDTLMQLEEPRYGKFLA